MLATLPDALADALGRVVSDVRREARAEIETIKALHRAEIAELKTQTAETIAGLRAASDAAAGRVNEALARVRDGRDGIDGKNADPDLIEQMVAEKVAALPPPERGEKGDPGEPGASGKDGRDAAPIDPAVVGEMVSVAVERTVGALPLPQDGKDGDPGTTGPAGRDGADGAPGVPGEPGEKGEAGKDGVGLAGAMIDRGGNLVVTLTDGAARELGTIVGKDGAPGERGQDGKDGADGRDGLSIEDLSADFDGERALVLRFARGDIVKEIPVRLPIPLYRGAFKDGAEYERGDVVTFGGTSFIAKAATTEKPEIERADGPWTIVAKRGRDGRHGKEGPKGDPGTPGRAGRDLTHLGSS